MNSRPTLKKKGHVTEVRHRARVREFTKSRITGSVFAHGWNKRKSVYLHILWASHSDPIPIGR